MQFPYSFRATHATPQRICTADGFFPAPHPDVMKQAIDYRVALDKYDDLAMYDGSVIVERTKGELAARCEMEGANFLAINLAHDVV